MRHDDELKYILRGENGYVEDRRIDAGLEYLAAATEFLHALVYANTRARCVYLAQRALTYIQYRVDGVEEGLPWSVIYDHARQALALDTTEHVLDSAARTRVERIVRCDSFEQYIKLYHSEEDEDDGRDTL